jgi:hypothetical protein
MTSLLPLLTFAQTHALDASLTGLHNEIPPHGQRRWYP